MRVGVLLAAGKGKRFLGTNENTNKVAVEFKGKPLVRYGMELFNQTCQETVVVVGANRESVTRTASNLKIVWAVQQQALGTGNAAKVAFEEIIKAKIPAKVVIVGYGDHMMFYKPATIERLANLIEKGATISLVTTKHDDPDKLAWGRIVRSETGLVARIVEQKEANEDERKINELNAGLYAFDFDWALEAIKKLKPAKVSGEYYLTDLIGQATKEKRAVEALTVEFGEVGFGINTVEELKKDELLVQREG